MQRLKKSTLFYYSLTDIPIIMSLFPVAVFLPQFYASNMGVSLALVGTIMFSVRIFDVLTDPLMGFISDHTRTRFGKRKPWIFLATPILMLSTYMLFMPPEDAGALHLVVWYMVQSLGITMMLIPYYAWGAELSTDYNERSRVTGARAMAGITGNLTAQLVPGAAMLFFGIGGSSVVLQLVGISMLVLMPLCVGITLRKTPEPEYHQASVLPVLEGLKLMWSNGPFKQLVLAFMIGFIGLSITTPLYLFFIKFWLGAEDQAIYMLTFFYLSSFAAVPFWVWLARHIGKHRAYLAAFFTLAFAHPFYLLLGQDDFWWMLPITLATGFASGGFSATLPNSMKADVIDLDTLNSGQNRAALFFSAWSFAQKATASVGGAIAMFGLALLGFDAETPANNGADEFFGLRFLFSTFPSLFFLAGAAVVWNYPITEERHAEIRAQLDAREKAGAAPAASAP